MRLHYPGLVRTIPLGPLQSLKFGLQYSYQRTDWLQVAGPNVTAGGGNNLNKTDLGDNHRVMFAGFFYF